jgi:hypothetical protein
MSFTIAVAGSQGKLSVVAVETVELPRDQLKYVVRSSTPLPDGKPEDQLAVVLAVEKAVVAENGGAEPRMVIQYTARGAAIYGFLDDDYKIEPRLVEVYGGQPRRTRPLAMTHVASPGAANFFWPLNRLTSGLSKTWRAHRLEFAPGLDNLKRQVASFAPVETKAGNLQLADEADAYSGEVVALMYALRKREGYGVKRYETSDGTLWPSRAAAVAKLGQGAMS